MKLPFTICVLIATLCSPPCYADIDKSKQADILMLAPARERLFADIA